jgi:hypothetical protein
MPIWLRRFTFKSIQEFYENEKEAQEEMQNKVAGVQKASSQNTVMIPEAVKRASYTTKKQS